MNKKLILIVAVIFLTALAVYTIAGSYFVDVDVSGNMNMTNGNITNLNTLFSQSGTNLTVSPGSNEFVLDANITFVSGGYVRDNGTTLIMGHR